jgi:disulfide bond formation protein DsbB
MKHFLISVFVLILIASLIFLLSDYFIITAVVLLTIAALGSYIGVAIYFYHLGQRNLVTGGQLVMQANQANDEMDAVKIRAIGGLINAVKAHNGSSMAEDNTKYLLPEPNEIQYSPFLIEQDERQG